MAATVTATTSSANVPATMRAVVLNKTGDASVLELDAKATVPTPGAGQLLVRVAAAGVNYIDTYHRSGLYAVKLPFTPGREGAGTVVAVASDVTTAKVGDRVAFLADATYAEYALVSAARAVPVPPKLSLTAAAGLMLQGITAHYLCTSTYAIQRGDTILVHAGAGGTGQLIIQIAKIKGAKVITTVGSKAKEDLVRSLGADHIINYTLPNTDIVADVKKFTGGTGVQVAYDGVGKDTWQASLHSLARLGMLVLFGNASGKVPPIDPLELSKQGSVSLCRPTMYDYIVTPQQFTARVSDLLQWLNAGQLKLDVSKHFSLEQAADAHRYLESRASTGKIVIIANAEDSK